MTTDDTTKGDLQSTVQRDGECFPFAFNKSDNLFAGSRSGHIVSHDACLKRASDSRSYHPQQFPQRPGSRVSTWQPQSLPQGDARRDSRRDWIVGEGPRRVSRLLVEWVGRDREKHHRTDYRGEIIRRWAARSLVLLLTRLRGSEQPPVDLSHPRCPARPQLRRVSIGLRSTGTVRPRNFPRAPVQPDGQTNH